MKRKKLIIATLILISISITGCIEIPDDIVGSWKNRENDAELVFNSDGKLMLVEGTSITDGRWEQEGDILTLTLYNDYASSTIVTTLTFIDINTIHLEFDGEQTIYDRK